MTDSTTLILGQMAVPVAIAISWAAGEVAHRWLAIPKVSGYGIAGFLMAGTQGGFLHVPMDESISLLANFAFALILFELGYRINLLWLRANPILGLTSIVESAATFVAVFMVARAFALEQVPALLLSALAMATSPAAVVRVANELKSSGQVTERLLHLSAFNCVLAAIAFKVVLGYWVVSTSGTLFDAVWSSIVVLAVSTGIGALFGVAVPVVHRVVSGGYGHATVAFAIAALLLTALTAALKFSPLLAALSFGLVARHRRVGLSQADRNFGALGDLLTVVLFMCVATALDWRQVFDGLGLAIAVIGARLFAKLSVTTALARLGGTTFRKGLLTGLAMTPMSVFVIQLLEQTRHLQLATLESIAGVAAIVLLLEIFGPLVTQLALRWAGEGHIDKES